MTRSYTTECKKAIRSHGLNPDSITELKYGLLQYLSLGDDEVVDFACHCIGKRIVTHSGNLIITNKQVIFMLSKLGGVHMDTYSYSQISNVSEKVGLLTAELNINSTGDKGMSVALGKKEAVIAAKCIRQNSSKSKQQPTTVHFDTKMTAGNTSGDIISQLERLKKLKDAEAITEQEYQDLKSKLLG